MSLHDSEASPSPDLAEPTAPEADPAQYKALSASTVISLLLGIAASAAWIGPLLWIVPGLGIAVSIFALRTIARNPESLAGRKMALAGLFLSLLFGSAAASQSLSRTWWLRGEARQVAERWCELLADDEPAQAQQMMVTADKRHLDDPTLWTYYRNTVDAREALEEFVTRPEVRFLLAHGKQVQVRFFTAESLGQAHDGADMVRMYYAVTRNQDGEKETFFLRFALRRDLGNPDLRAWTISEVRSRVNPFDDPA